MRLEIASAKAIRYACLTFHYAKRQPAPPCVGFSVFNSNGEWCGVIVFNNGMGGIEKPFDLQKGQVCELARVALNGKQESTGECVAIALRLFKKLNPLVKVVVSYADSDQNHTGVTYQATNWFFIGSKRTSDEYIDPKTKRSVHSRGHSNAGFKIQFGVKKSVPKTSDLIRIKKGLKHKYAFGLYKSEKRRLETMSFPYPKNADEALPAVRLTSSQEEGFDSTHPLKITTV